MAGSSSVGPNAVASQAIRPLNNKQKTAWRPILGRMQLLQDLVSNYGVGSQSGLSIESIMNYIKDLGAFAHNNGEVRESAKDLTVALQKQVGTEALEKYLKVLRPKQLEEYYAAFDGTVGGSGSNSARGKQDDQIPVVQKKTNKNDSSISYPPQNHVTHASGGKVNTSAERVTNKSISNLDESLEDFTLCSFCGVKNKSWNEDALDLHYWKECPLLSPCPGCAQVVEIAGLPDHLLSECEQKSKFTLCEATGLAIRTNEFDPWSKSPNCKPPPPNCMYCPLCLATVEDSDDAWRQHLILGCPQNPRSRVSAK